MNYKISTRGMSKRLKNKKKLEKQRFQNLMLSLLMNPQRNLLRKSALKVHQRRTKSMPSKGMRRNKKDFKQILKPLKLI